MPMNIVISKINIDGYTIQTGDEIAVFDHGLLVGATVIQSLNNDVIHIVVAMDDPLTKNVDGFIEGNIPTFRLKSANSLTSILLRAKPVFGSPTFMQLETFVCTLEGSLTAVNETQDNLSDVRCIPNPANNYTSIVYTLQEDALVLLEVYDLSGRKIKVLQNEMMLSGRQQYRFDTGALKKGLYIIKLQVKLKSGSKSKIIKFVKN